ncbi:NAD(P)-dependent alcohol dehydrogenase [Mangrovimonas sp. AS39]|uniref:NAD(P)-dependent alcohol dehydrogenase n=1 Tax=Mangrovimonas futianensis TaxID=2895523 RepID=UPI001E5FD0B1|nr:NAD(P)-dependent alcohol dehydrogenase [Mangrovimonas futianensis]MCF1191741.1 NAD(P)-dependent alcohol dehydrogenase [Mangrovimonas futianensis]MCF1195371.1 NAD(P)-dependent alcohol dehydrogenase [Mangrovimonas futianensis]
MNHYSVKAYGAESAETDLLPLQIDRRTVTNTDVKIDILYCGVCHSDLHFAKNDWGMTQYPVVPGHEIVGRVVEVGSKVSKHKVDDIVAVGCLVDSCRTCQNCKNDLEQYCPEWVGTYGGYDKHLETNTHGGYSETIVVDEAFVLSVPENLDLAGIAPVLCAGITTWSPLRHWNVGKDSKVAVVGLGGLGHMAIKLANALGAHVTLFSRSKGKIDDAKKLGAHDVVISTDEAAMEQVMGKFDVIIDTVPYVHDLNPYVNTLNTNGTLVVVGYLGPLDPMLVTVPMIMGRKSVAGSLIGGIAETQELLDFCGEHNITSDIEVIKIQDINSAYERMLKSDVKYRFVIDMSSLKS